MNVLSVFGVAVLMAVLAAGEPVLRGQDTAAGPTLVASPGVCVSSPAEVKLEWSGIPSPSADNAIEIYSPAVPVFVGYVNVTESDSWDTGAGKVKLPLVNTRQTYVFQYMDAPGGNVIAVSNQILFSPNQPHHIRLSLADPQGQSMRVMWTTADNTTLPRVQYGLSSTSLTSTGMAVSYTYNVTDMCAAPATDSAHYIPPGVFHDAVMEDLKPNTRYYYRVGSSSAGYSQVQSFWSPPIQSAETATHIIAFADLGVHVPFVADAEMQYPANKTVHWTSSLLDKWEGVHPTQILHIGDISYARGNAWIWDFFMSSIEPLAARAPYHVGIGNHEYDYIGQPFKPSWAGYSSDSGGECGVPYGTRFNMPGSSSNVVAGDNRKVRNLWYSWDFGNVHFTFMSTEHDFTQGSEQWTWLDKDLAAVNRTKTPFVIFNGHRPMVSSSEYGSGDIRYHLQDEVGPLLDKYRVDLALWGHVHKYERSCGLASSAERPLRCAPYDSDGTVHAVIGMSGNDYQVKWEHIEGSTTHFVPPEWSMFRTAEFGYTTIETTHDTLTFTFFGDQRNDVHDKVELKRKEFDA